MVLEIRPLSSGLGGEVLGLDLSQPLDAEIALELRHAWWHHQVLLFRNQTLTLDDQRRFVGYLGELQPTRSRPGQRKNPDIMYIANREIEGEPGDLPEGDMQFHQDQCYYETPARGAVLYAIEIPSTGGNTIFANMYRAFETLPAALREQLIELDVLFIYDYLKNSYKRATTDWAEAPRHVHPAVIVHPDTGRPALFVNRLMADSIVGLPRAESEALLNRLFDHIERSDAIYEHAWRPGDVLVWDNFSTAHARTDFDPAERRVLRRMAIKGLPPMGVRQSAAAAESSA